MAHHVGSFARVTTADYQLVGEVRCVFKTLGGRWRYVIQFEPGILHIQSERQMSPVKWVRPGQLGPPWAVSPEWRFKRGDRIRKASGDYHPAGTVLAEFTAHDNQPYYVIEHAEGVLHIYRESAVMAFDGPGDLAAANAALLEEIAGLRKENATLQAQLTLRDKQVGS